MANNPNECPEKPGYTCPRLVSGHVCLKEKDYRLYLDLCKKKR